MLSQSDKLVVQPPDNQHSAITHQLQLMDIHQPHYNVVQVQLQLGFLQLLALIIAIGGVHQLADQLVDQHPVDQLVDQLCHLDQQCHPKLNKSPNSQINSSPNVMLTRTLS